MGLLVLTALVAGGALFAKYRLEGLKGALLDTARARTGAELHVEEISAFGLRGLRAEKVRVAYQAQPGVSIQLDVPEVLIYIDLIDLFSGALSVERVQVDGALLTLGREEGEPWLHVDSVADPRSRDLSAAAFPFRVSGAGCRVEVQNVVRDTRLDLGAVDFDVVRLSESPTISGDLAGNLSDDEEKRVRVDLEFTSLSDFDFRINFGKLTADDVNIFLPASQHIIRNGSASPTLRLNGNADQTVSVSMEADFSDLQVRDQPEYLAPASGRLTAYGTYEPVERVVRLSMAKAESDAIEGNLSGAIRFGDGAPTLDLRLSSTRLPVREILSSVLEGQVEKYGSLEYSIDALDECTVSLSGTTEDPVIRASAAAEGGQLTFKSRQRNWPDANLRMGRFAVAWDSVTRQPSGSILIRDGTVNHRASELEADAIAGTVTLADGKVTINPLRAMFLGQPLVATAEVEVATQSGNATISGTLSNVESTKLSESIRNTRLAGGGSVNIQATFKNGNVRFESDVDATQTEIAYRWWFLKPVGIGASGRVTGEFVPKKTLSCNVNGLVAGTQLKAATNLVYTGTRWRLKSARAESPSLDVVSVGKCLPLPYTITGGTGTDGFYEWTRENPREDAWSAHFGLTLDEITVRAEESDFPIACKGVRGTGTLISGDSNTGELSLDVDSGITPPLGGGRWFAPMVRDFEKFPPVDRRWMFHLKAKALEVPPWKGTDFTGEGYATLTEMGLTRYAATVDEGRVEGAYLSNRTENSYESMSKWNNVSATYLMDTLDQPHVFRGNMSGEVSYSRDRDDPGTLRGAGSFTMGEGQFSADYLLSMLEQQMDNAEVSSLPPSLRFSSLEAGLEFDKDVVRTPRIELVSDAIKLSAKGQFVTDGDMNYDIKVAVTPDAAERIPLLADNFNVQGHRLAQQDIELAFTLSGPTLRPVSALAETPPVHVTLVSGALEAANEAIRVIDAPRKILVDLLKIGGGIVGARKQSQSESAE